MSEEEMELESRSGGQHLTESENERPQTDMPENRRVLRRRIPRGEKIGENAPGANQGQEAYQRPSAPLREGRPSYYESKGNSYYHPSRGNDGYNHFGSRRPPYNAHNDGRYDASERHASYGHRSVQIYGEGGSDYNTRPRGSYQRQSPYENGYQRQNPPYERPRAPYRENRLDEYGQPYSEWASRPMRAPRPMRQNAPAKRPHGKPRHKSTPMTSTPREVVRYKEMNIDMTQPIRLNKYLANSGVCSRRDADKFIEQGLVTVNGNVVTELGTKVLRTDSVMFKNKLLTIGDKVYVLLNKPINYVTTNDDPENRKTVLDLVKNACPERIYPVGRLDRNTSGVLLLTNDGELASTLTHPKFLKKKIYHVFLNKDVSEEDMEKIRSGILLEDGEIKADAVEYAQEDSHREVGIEIHSGKNRIVRRIFENLGYRVNKLDRVYFAGLTNKNVKRGQWRYLTTQEVIMLKMGAFE